MTKLHRVLKRHGVTTISLVRLTKTVDPDGKGYSRTYIYGLRRGEVENPTRQCMAIVLAATRQITGVRSIQLSDLFDLEERVRKAS